MSHTYFSELKDWSIRKHKLLTSYLKGFVRILGGATAGRVYYIDGFAGPGLYDDGAKGSPLLAAEYAERLVHKNYSLHCINVEVDKELYTKLVQNTSPHQKVTTNLFGAFADNVSQIIGQIQKRPAIFFLDPFGVKGIEMKHLAKVLSRPYITEILLRVNPHDLRRLAGFSDSKDGSAISKCRLLTDLYGFLDARSWRQVWHSQGVEGLINLYMESLGDRMSLGGKVYVCKYPIRSIEGELKYYLVFATRHAKGAVLMNDTVYNREETYERELKEYQANQPHQLSMFDIPEPTEEEIFGDKVERLKEDIWLQFQGTTASHLSIHEAMLDKWFGRVKGSHFTRAFREMKEEGRIANLSGPPSHHDTLIAFKA